MTHDAARTADPGSHSTANGSSSAPTMSPFEAAIEARLGFTIAEIGAIVNQRMEASTTACLRDLGWTTEAVDLIPPELEGSEGTSGGTSLEMVIANFEASVAEQDTPPPDDPEFLTAQFQCLEQVRSGIEDPLAELVALLDQGREDLNSRVQADARYVESRQRYERCLKDLGMTQSDIDAHSQDLVAQANGVIDRYVSGELTVADTRIKLGELRSRELESLGRASDCHNEQQRVEREVYYEVESRYIDENEAQFNELLDRADESLSTFEQYFPE